MKIGLTLAALASLGLAACSGTDADKAAAPDEDAVNSEPTAFVMTPGAYEIVGDNVVYSRTDVMPDGTYVDSAEGKEIGRGTWSVSGAKSCFDPEGDGPDQQERCWTNSAPSADGSFTTTREDGSESYMVRPVAGE